MNLHYVRLSAQLTVAALCLSVCGCPVSTGGDSNDNGNLNGNGNTNENANENGNDNGSGNGSTGAKLVVFADPDSDFTTSDVHDVQDEIIRLVAGQVDRPATGHEDR